jgi:hypothetical protein
LQTAMVAAVDVYFGHRVASEFDSAPHAIYCHVGILRAPPKRSLEAVVLRRRSGQRAG